MCKQAWRREKKTSFRMIHTYWFVQSSQPWTPVTFYNLTSPSPVRRMLPAPLMTYQYQRSFIKAASECFTFMCLIYLFFCFFFVPLDEESSEDLSEFPAQGPAAKLSFSGSIWQSEESLLWGLSFPRVWERWDLEHWSVLILSLKHEFTLHRIQ